MYLIEITLQRTHTESSRYRRLVILYIDLTQLPILQALCSGIFFMYFIGFTLYKPRTASIHYSILHLFYTGPTQLPNIKAVVKYALCISLGLLYTCPTQPPVIHNSSLDLCTARD